MWMIKRKTKNYHDERGRARYSDAHHIHCGRLRATDMEELMHAHPRTLLQLESSTSEEMLSLPRLRMARCPTVEVLVEEVFIDLEGALS